MQLLPPSAWVQRRDMRTRLSACVGISNDYGYASCLLGNKTMDPMPIVYPVNHVAARTEGTVKEICISKPADLERSKILEARIGDVDLLSESERTEVMLASQGRMHARPATDLIEMIAIQAKRYPEKQAVVGPEATLTYAELEARSNQMARQLRARGVTRGSRVGVAVQRGSDEVVLLLAILKAGGAYVPVNPVHPAARIRIVLEDAAPQVLITSKSSPIATATPAATEVLFLAELASTLSTSDASPLGESVTTDQIAYVLFTSGSTGRPKGVEVLRSGFSSFLRSMAHMPGLTECDRLLAVTTTTFDIAGLELFLPLYVGATVVVVDSVTASDPRLLRRRLETESVTIMQATPATWRLLVEENWQGDGRLRILCGGEALNRDLARKLLSRGSELWNLYGPTETTVWSTVERVLPQHDIITIGRPIDCTQVYVLDSTLRQVPVGVIGELYIGGAGLARGYLGNAELTAQRFVSNPFGKPGDRIYRTGDLARLRDDGRFECLGRVDHQVKIRGYRIELGEIESALRSARGVKEVVVVANTEHAEDPKLLAYFVGESARAALFEIARSKLPTYMVPSAFVRLDAFPLTTSGKVDRKALPKADANAQDESGGRPPKNDTESRVASVWGELLGVTRIGADDDLFAHGATSIMVIRARARLEQEFGTKLPLQAFLESPTIEGISQHIERHHAAPREPFRGLWRIRSGDGRVPVLVVHGDDACRLLPPHLSNDQSIYGYLHQCADGDRMPNTTVEQLAQRCHAEWLEVCGDAPCAIMGHSYGGLVAWHVAHLRRQAGLPVGVLALVDTFHPITERRMRKIGWQGIRSWWVQVRRDIVYWITLARAEIAFRTRRSVPIASRKWYINAQYEIAAQRYEPPVLDTDVLYFGATDNSSGSSELTAASNYESWHHTTCGQFEAYPASGTHCSIVLSANEFGVIGRTLGERLDLLRNSGGTSASTSARPVTPDRQQALHVANRAQA